MVRNNVARDLFTDEYRPEQAITGSKFVNQAGKNLQVLFPPWHGGGVFYELLIKRLARQGNAVLAYYFHDEILRPDVEQVAASFAHIRDTVSEHLTAVSGNYTKTKLIAMSLGNPALAMVTSQFTEFDSATLVVGASSLARSMARIEDATYPYWTRAARLRFSRRGSRLGRYGTY